MRTTVDIPDERYRTIRLLAAFAGAAGLAPVTFDKALAGMAKGAIMLS